MFLKAVSLKNFRNFSKLDFRFDQNTTVLIGENAQGKSNFLEAIYFLATARSPRAEKDEELIKQGEDGLHVAGRLGQDIRLSVGVQLTEGQSKKRVKVNGVARRVGDYSENLVVVLFAPDDVNLVTGSPSLRRAHIDQVISQVDRLYKKSLTEYENVVVRKNRILKAVSEGLAGRDQLAFWIERQVSLGQLIGQKRRRFFGFINMVDKKFGDFSYDYQPSEISLPRLALYQEREIASASSLVGPHRDDFLFLLSGRDLSRFGSRGEQRTSVLDLKSAEVSFAEAVLGNRPVLLLDDIFSELDEKHRSHVVDLAKMQQTVIATVEFDKFLGESLAGAGLYEVKSGFILDLEPGRDL